MKRLFLLRHAQTLPLQSGADKERTLTPQGQEDAIALGETMQKKALQPNLILCSYARRTQQTCEAVKQGAAFSPRTLIQPELYDARRGDLLAAIQSVNDDVETLMLVGHNPAIYELCIMLSSEDPHHKADLLSEGYAPGTLSVFEVPAERWADINPDHCKLIDLLSPTDYNAHERSARRI